MEEQYLDRSVSLVKLADALCKAQASLENPKKDKENPHFRAMYADLASDWDACRKPLSDNGLCLIQTMKMLEPSRLILRTTLLHISGEWISSDYPIAPIKPDPQGYKSAVTYARRTALEAIIGLAPGDDDDGNAASQPPSPPRAKLTIDREKMKTPLQETIDRVGAKRPDLATKKDFEHVLATENQIKKLFAMMHQAGMDADQLKAEIGKLFKKDSTKKLTKAEIQQLFVRLEGEIAYRQAEGPSEFAPPEFGNPFAPRESGE